MLFNKITLKFLIILLLVYSSSVTLAQDLPKGGYIMLDSLTSNFKITHYTLNTKALYDIDKTIEIYNVPLRSEEVLLTLSVLPSFKENDAWVKVDFDSIKNHIIETSQIRKYALAIFNYPNIENTSLFKFHLVKNRGADYLVSRACLTQRFNVYNYPHPLRVALKNLINVGSLPLTLQQFQEKLTQYAIPMNPKNDHAVLLDKGLLGEYYLSQKITIKGDNAYQFWTFNDWVVKDGWNSQRGIDRFVYIPGKGIVGGSYDFWFSFKPWRDQYNNKNIPVSPENIWNNMLHEKVMLAEELTNK